jgi:hypothetical protein
MEENIFEKIPELDKLLENKSFSELSGSEKKEVLRYMNPEEYEASREFILESKKQFLHERNTLTPDPSIRTRLLERMESNSRTKTGFTEMLRSLLTFRIPVYQPAFTIAILVVLLFILTGRNHETVRYLARTDTVYVEKPTVAVTTAQNEPFHEKKVAVSPVKKKTTEKKLESLISSGKKANLIHKLYAENAYQKIQLTTSFKGGRSASDDSALMKLLVAAN